MKKSQTSYRGAEALTFTTKALELVVTTGVGPRVVSLRSLAGKAQKSAQNIFLQFPEDEPRAHGLLHFRGGHRLWHSPEQIPRTYQPDDEPLAVKPLPKGVALVQPTEEKTGIRKGMKIEVFGESTIKVTHGLVNHNAWAIETAPWALTMFRAGGYAALPLLPKGDHARGDLLPNYSLVPWTYTDFSHPCWDMHRDYIGLDVTKCRVPQKLGITNYPGWSAYWLDGVTFVKYASVLPDTAYPDMGCPFELFSNGKMIELETLGAYGKVEPESSVTHIEYWTLFDGLDKPATDKAFAALQAAVDKWLAKLK